MFDAMTAPTPPEADWPRAQIDPALNYHAYLDEDGVILGLEATNAQGREGATKIAPALYADAVGRGERLKLVDGHLVSAPLPQVPAPVPASVTKAQAKIALHRAGLLDAVRTAVSGDPEMQIWFDDAALWERDNPHVVALGEGGLMLSSEQIDGLFIAASQIAA